MNQEKNNKELYKRINKRNNSIQILCSIIQGIGISLIFLPIYKSFSQNISSLIVFIGFMLFLVGFCIKIKKIIQ